MVRCRKCLGSEGLNVSQTALPETRYCWKFSSGSVEVSREELSGLLDQVESELRSSTLYCQVLDSLQRLPDDLSNQVQQMVNAIGKAGVQLALRKLITKKVDSESPLSSSRVPEATVPGATVSGSAAPAASSPMGTEQAVAEESVRLVPPAVMDNLVIRQAPLSDSQRAPRSRTAGATLTATPKRFSKKQRAAQVALESWHDRLRSIGQELQQARLAHALSLQQVHFRTQIPVHRLQSLEAGTVEPLVEDDIYLRGFIRRAGDILGLDGMALADSLPAPVATPVVVPSWDRSSRQDKVLGGVHIGRAYLYVGYAALLTGGMSWVSYQMAARQASSFTPLDTPTSVTPQDAQPASSPDNGAASSTHTQARPAANVATNVATTATVSARPNPTLKGQPRTETVRGLRTEVTAKSSLNLSPAVERSRLGNIAPPEQTQLLAAEGALTGKTKSESPKSKRIVP